MSEDQYLRKAEQWLGRASALQELLQLRFAVAALAETCGALGSYEREMANNAHRGIRERIEYLHDSLLREMPKPSAPPERVGAKMALTELASYFCRTADLWEGPDGCGTDGTDLCHSIANSLTQLAATPMALGLTRIPPFPGAIA